MIIKVRSNSTEWPSGGEIKCEPDGSSAVFSTSTIQASQFNDNSLLSSNNNQATLNANSSNNGFAGSPPSPLPSSYAGNERTINQSSSSKKKAKQLAEDEEDSKGILFSLFFSSLSFFSNKSFFAEIIKVYDGNTSFRKRMFRTISINKNCSYVSILVSFFSFY